MAKALPLKFRAREASHVKHHELAWMHGRVSVLLLEDFVGAAFGAVFFTVTSEVWEIAKGLGAINIFAISNIVNFVKNSIPSCLARFLFNNEVKLRKHLLHFFLNFFRVAPKKPSSLFVVNTSPFDAVK